jgi:hypothetical protein
MNVSEVIKIMGTPKEKLHAGPLASSTTIYVYEPIFSSSEGIFIQINDSLNKVQGIEPCGD